MRAAVAVVVTMVALGAIVWIMVMGAMDAPCKGDGMTLEHMKRTAIAHGFEARVETGSGVGARVVVRIPWTQPCPGCFDCDLWNAMGPEGTPRENVCHGTGRVEGTAEESCTDARGLAHILGY